MITYSTLRAISGDNRDERLITLREGEWIPVRASRDKHLVSTGEYDAWLFDLDGGGADTASVHATLAELSLV
jgi:hypothetical protein